MNTYVENINDIIHETSVDFVLRPCAREIHIVQYDKSLPIIKAYLYREGQPYQLPTNAAVHVRLGKLDHTFVYANILGMNEDRTIAYFEVSEQMAMIAGRVSPVIEVVYQGKVACSSPIPFVIDRNPVQEGQIESHDEFPIIYQLESDIEDHNDWIRRYTALTEFDGFVEGDSVWDDVAEGETKYCQSGSQTEDVPGENTVIKIDLSQQHLSKAESKALYIKKIIINYTPDGQEEEETYEYTFNSRIFGNGSSSPTIEPLYADLTDNNSGTTLRWYLNYLLAEGVSSYFGNYNGTKGQQFGSNNNPPALISLSTSSLENCTVNSIYVEVSSNSGTKAKCKLTIVNDVWTCDDTPDPQITSDNEEYEWLHEPNGTHLGSSSGGQVIHHYNHVFLKKENGRVSEVEPDPALQYMLSDYSATYKYSNVDNLLHQIGSGGGGSASFEVLSQIEVSHDSEENVTFITFPKNIMPKVMYLEDTNSYLYFDYVNLSVYDGQGREVQYDDIQCTNGSIVIPLSGYYSISPDYDYISYDVFDGYDNPLRHTSLQINWYEVYNMQDIYATQDYVDEEIAYALTSVYKPKGSSTVSNLNTISKSAAMSGDVYNMSDDGSLTNEDSSTIDVLSGDNVVFCWNSGSWYWDKMAATVDLSNYVTKDGNENITGVKNFKNNSNLLTFKRISSTSYSLIQWNLYLELDSTLVLASGSSTSKGIKLNESSLCPVVTNSMNLGSISLYWNQLYLKTITIISGGSANPYIDASQYNSGIYFHTGSNTVETMSVVGNNIATRNLLPILDGNTGRYNVWDIGTTTKKYRDLYLDRDLYLGGSLKNGDVSVSVANIAQKGSSLWASGTFDSNGEFTIDMETAGTPNGLYYVTYGHCQCFITLLSAEINNLGANDSIRAPIPLIVSGQGYVGNLRVTKSGTVLTFKVAAPGISQVDQGFVCYIYKTNLM